MMGGDIVAMGSGWMMGGDIVFIREDGNDGRIAKMSIIMGEWL